MTTNIVYRFVFSIPSFGALVNSENDFDTFEDGEELIGRAYEDGQINGYYVDKITTTTTTERVYEIGEV